MWACGSEIFLVLQSQAHGYFQFLDRLYAAFADLERISFMKPRIAAR